MRLSQNKLPAFLNRTYSCKCVQKFYLEAQLDPESSQLSPGQAKMPMLQIDSTYTQRGKERRFKTAGKSDSSWAELPSASAGLCPLSVQEVKDELALNKILL